MKLIFILTVSLLFTGNAFAGTASSKLSGLAGSLIKGYSGKYKGKKSVVAIFPLNCEAKLEKRRVGFAASEIMSHKFVASKNFTVAERGELNKLLAEQKLQASGAVESETAVKLGKILGADVVLVGNIQKVGGKYQVNARLVNAETSEVLVSGYEELNSNAFEEDAKAYLSLVPEEQAIGLYLLYNTRANSNNLPAFSYTNIYSGGIEHVTPTVFNSGLLGGGIRYFPTSKIVVDLAYMESRDNLMVAGGTGEMSMSVKSGRALLGRKFMFSSKLFYYICAGATYYSLAYENNYFTPTANFRLEFRPQSRIGISIAGSFDFTRKPATVSGGGKYGQLDNFSLEPSISLNF